MNKMPDKPVVAATGNVDIERFAHNLARLVEQGGKALAAYLKPREEGAANVDFPEQVNDAFKTLGHVAEYWLSDPARAVELQRRLGGAYLDLWGNAVKRMAGENIPPAIQSDPKDKRFADPEWSENQFFDFLKQAYLLSTQWAEKLVADAQSLDPHARQKAEFTNKVLHEPVSSPTRSARSTM